MSRSLPSALLQRRASVPAYRLLPCRCCRCKVCLWETAQLLAVLPLQRPLPARIL
jgi:hypothetical protein